MTTFGVAVVFTVPCSVAQNIQTLLVCRALGGIAISVPVANVCLLSTLCLKGIPSDVYHGVKIIISHAKASKTFKISFS